MLIYFDLNRGRLVSSPGSGDSLAGIEFKRGDTLPVTVRFTRGLEIVELPTGATGIIAIKPVGSYDVEPLASAVSWVKTGTAETSSYDFTLNLSTTGLNTALGVGTPVDVPWIAVNFELQFTVSGNVTSSQTVPAIVHNDVIRDTDLTPTPLPDLTSWLDAQLAARDYIPATEKGTTEGKIPVLGADGKLDPARLPSVALTTTSTVANAAARLALSSAAAAGKIIVEADTGKSYGLIANGTPANSADWIQLGDRDIAIADVIGLPAALAEKETPAAAQTKADTAQAAAISAAATDATNKANAAQAAAATDATTKANAAQAAAATDATTKANAAQAAAISAAATNAATKANLSGGNIFSGLQQNSGIVTSSAALGTDPTQLPTQAQVRAITAPAYVEPLVDWHFGAWSGTGALTSRGLATPTLSMTAGTTVGETAVGRGATFPTGNYASSTNTFFNRIHQGLPFTLLIEGERIFQTSISDGAHATLVASMTSWQPSHKGLYVRIQQNLGNGGLLILQISQQTFTPITGGFNTLGSPVVSLLVSGSATTALRCIVTLANGQRTVTNFAPITPQTGDSTLNTHFNVDPTYLNGGFNAAIQSRIRLYDRILDI